MASRNETSVTVADPGTVEPRRPKHPEDQSGGKRPVELGPMVVVPLVDEQEAGRIYDGSILWAGVVGGLLGALLLGVPAYLVGSGAWLISGLGQFGASGAGVAAFTGAGIGLSVGALVGAVIAVLRLPSRRPSHMKDQA